MDFCKAYDSISHTYIQNALKQLNFGEDFCDWIWLFLGAKAPLELAKIHVSVARSLARSFTKKFKHSQYLLWHARWWSQFDNDNSRYIKKGMDDPLCVPLFVPLFVPLIFQMLIFQPKMKIMPQNFQDMILGVYKIHQECHGWPIVGIPVRTPVCTLFVPLIFQMLIFQPKIKIMPPNFQDRILGVYQIHQ